MTDDPTEFQFSATYQGVNTLRVRGFLNARLVVRPDNTGPTVLSVHNLERAEERVTHTFVDGVLTIEPAANFQRWNFSNTIIIVSQPTPTQVEVVGDWFSARIDSAGGKLVADFTGAGTYTLSSIGDSIISTNGPLKCNVSGVRGKMAALLSQGSSLFVENGEISELNLEANDGSTAVIRARVRDSVVYLKDSSARLLNTVNRPHAVVGGSGEFVHN